MSNTSCTLAVQAYLAPANSNTPAAKSVPPTHVSTRSCQSSGTCFLRVGEDRDSLTIWQFKRSRTPSQQLPKGFAADLPRCAAWLHPRVSDPAQRTGNLV